MIKTHHADSFHTNGHYMVEEPPRNHIQIKSSNHYSPFIYNPHSVSQVKNLDAGTRPRIFSYQDQIRSIDHEEQSMKYLNLVKTKIKKHEDEYKQSNGIMNQPPEYIENKYTFKNDSNHSLEETSCFLNPCCSIIKETRREVYLSPTQLISAGYFYKNLKKQAKSLKSQKPGNMVQRSFFRDTRNVVQ